MIFKNKLLKVFIFFFFIIPINALAYSSHVILGGENVGIEVHSKGIMVVGFYQVNNSYIGRDAGLELGDKIVEVNDTKIDSINEMIKTINKDINNNSIKLTISRNNKNFTTNLKLIKDKSGIYKTGLYVKDQISGIGTLTYIDPDTKIFGALGHEIVESNTNTKMEIKDGKIFKSTVTGAFKSTSNKTGEKSAKFFDNVVYGSIEDNTISGIFGTYTAGINKNNLIEVGNVEDISLGEAYIRTVLNGEKVENFKINILKINDDSTTKNILFEITDDALLNKTNGVIKGMSGSPIVQNNKLIGAVTHAIVNDNKKGYGIFITTMLKEGED